MQTTATCSHSAETRATRPRSKQRGRYRVGQKCCVSMHSAKTAVCPGDAPPRHGLSSASVFLASSSFLTGDGSAGAAGETSSAFTRRRYGFFEGRSHVW